MTKELYLDYDDVSVETIEGDIELFRAICPFLKYQIYNSRPDILDLDKPDKGHYHVKIYNIDIPMHIVLSLMQRTQCDPAYIALVKHKLEFFIRNSSRYEKIRGTIEPYFTPPPVLIKEG